MSFKHNRSPIEQVTFKPSQAARRQGVGKRTVMSWLRAGLPYSKLPNGHILIHKDDLDAWIRSFQKKDEAAEMAADLVAKL